MQMTKGATRTGLTYIFNTASLPGNPANLVTPSTFSTSFQSAIRAEPGCTLIFDHLVRNCRIMAHLMPPKIASIAEHNHIICRAVTSPTPLT